MEEKSSQNPVAVFSGAVNGSPIGKEDVCAHVLALATGIGTLDCGMNHSQSSKCAINSLRIKNSQGLLR